MITDDELVGYIEMFVEEHGRKPFDFDEFKKWYVAEGEAEIRMTDAALQRHGQKITWDSEGNPHIVDTGKMKN